MNLENRLNHLELKIRATIPVVEVPFNPDDCIAKMGLDPAAVRESSRRTNSSLAEALSVMLGIEPREFLRQIKERANCGR